MFTVVAIQSWSNNQNTYKHHRSVFNFVYFPSILDDSTPAAVTFINGEYGPPLSSIKL